MQFHAPSVINHYFMQLAFHDLRDGATGGPKETYLNFSVCIHALKRLFNNTDQGRGI
jgi:hypothetical protein